MEKRKLKKVNIKGNRAIHYFGDKDNPERVFCSLEEYHNLAKKGAKQPTHKDGLKWLSSTIEPEFETEDGDLPNDSFAELDNERVIIKTKEMKFQDIYKKSEVVNNEIIIK